MALIPKFFPDCVVGIGVFSAEKNDFVWVASGFLYAEFVKVNDNGTKNYATYLVSNSHVFKDLSAAFIRCNPQASSSQARVFAVELLNEKQEPLWFRHSNDQIDIAVVP